MSPPNELHRRAQVAENVAYAALVLSKVSPSERRLLVVSACSFKPGEPEIEFQILGPIRAAFAACWEEFRQAPVAMSIAAETARDHVMELSEVGQFDQPIVPPESLAQFFVEFIKYAKPKLDAWQAYVEQMRRQSCPGCGDDACVF